ncbi:hypothetical protein KBX73_04935 [Acetobacter persici]|uniref:LysR substrate-binding domain-containing protein n=1 Tax=Acetobacter persici TaxID=1076596 RepID=UPI0020CE0B06|nr:LysR substrate-binding domain-containing protein [Acetobacter persici]MCP9319130.1 hypothetical protein [Acetobacter persici]
MGGLPSLALENDLLAGRLVHILTEYAPMPHPIHLLHLPGRRMPASLRAFIAFVRKSHALRKK